MKLTSKKFYNAQISIIAFFNAAFKKYNTLFLLAIKKEIYGCFQEKYKLSVWKCKGYNIS